MRTHLRDRSRALLAGALLLFVFSGSVARAQPPPTTQPSAAGFVDLNRAIRAYAAADTEAARTLFTDLLSADPQAEYRPTCLYYLGLIALEDGLGHVAGIAADPEVASREVAAAREEFTRAQVFFEQIVVLADPTAEMVRAALLLGIAQLARDDPSIQEEAIQLAERAAQTLERYVGETEAGAVDRYGQFYLMVARYRLALAYRNREPARARQLVDRAGDNLRQALAIARADLDGERIRREEYELFETQATYYDALLTLLRPDNRGARQRLETVAKSAARTNLETNARDIIAEIDKADALRPEPLKLPVPAPVGPFEVEGRVTVGNFFDSNVILLGKDTTLPRGFRRADDYRFELSADLNVSRYIPKAEAPWLFGESLTLGFGGGTYNGWQPNISQFDVNRYPARAYANWQLIPDLYFGLQYEYSYTQLGHAPFISSQRLTPVISKEWVLRTPDGPERNLGHTDVYYSHEARNYLDAIGDFRLNRDGTYHALGVGHTINFVQAKDLWYLRDYYASPARERERQSLGEEWLRFALGWEYRDERTVGTEFDLAGHALLWGLHIPLPYRFAFDLSGEFTWADYTFASVFDHSRKERGDFLQRYNLGLTYAFVARGELPQMRTLDVRLRTGIEVNFQNSNIWNRLGEDVYEYDRAIYGAALEVGF